MENYFTFTHLIGVRETNLPPYRDVRLQRYKSVQKIMDLIQIARKTQPQQKFPFQVTFLDEFDAQWDDVMPFPTIDYPRYVKLAFGLGLGLTFYSYNFNLFQNNIRFRNFRHFYPLVLCAAFYTGYSAFRTQVLKVNLFDEYCYLRADELAKQNEYLVRSEGFERAAWWNLDFKDTMKKINRQGNDNKESDFKDSELILQDFIDRYVDPNAKSPMEPFSKYLD